MSLRRMAACIALTLAGCHLIGDYDDLAPPTVTDPSPAACSFTAPCPEGTEPCVAVECVDGMCVGAPLPAGTTDVCESNGVCDGAGTCVGCVENAQCSGAKPFCIETRCVECTEPLHCFDQPGTSCNLDHSCECSGGTDFRWCERVGDCVNIQFSSDNCGACDHRCFGPCNGGSCTGAWEPLPLEDAPSPRTRHVAVSTYKIGFPAQLIVWGGAIGPAATDNTNTGAVYDPLNAYRWTALNIVSAPSPRRDATGVWTGETAPTAQSVAWNKMVVWGGHDGVSYLDTGAVYDLASNSWSPMSTVNAPSARAGHTAVWSGSQMVVWGGTDGNDQLGDGKRYEVFSDEWFDIASAPGREGHTAVWVGEVNKMVIYGGIGDTNNLTDAILPADGTPGGMQYSFDVMVIDDAGLWEPLETMGEPSARVLHTLIRHGSDVVVWGGHDGQSALGDGATLNLLNGPQWEPLIGVAPTARSGHTAVLVDSPARVLHWGGRDNSSVLADGGELDLEPIPAWFAGAAPALTPRSGHTAVQAGNDSVFIWGGVGTSGTLLGDGALYRVGLP
jgi:hypothetical protein